MNISHCLARSGTKLILAIAAAAVTMTGIQSAHAADLYHPDPASMSHGPDCPGEVLSFTGHEFMGSGMTMTYTMTVSPHTAYAGYGTYNVTVPIGDNDTAQTTVPAIPAGSYTVSLADAFGSGTAPGTLSVLPCRIHWGGNWVIAHTTMAFKPALNHAGPFKATAGTGSIPLTEPHDMVVANTAANASVKLTLPSDSCAALLGKGSATAVTTLQITWQPNSISPSAVTFTGFSATKTGTTIALRFGGGRTKVTESYAGPDGGASSTMTLTPALTRAKLARACAAKPGLTKLTIATGSLSLQ